MDIDLKLTEGMNADEEDFILERLMTHNAVTFGPSNRRELAVPLQGEDGDLIGGLTGYTGRGWLYISMLYVPDELRGQGLAGRMLDMAEAEARARGAIGAYIDTMNPEALKLYLKQGYTEIGTLKGLEGGHSVTWLEKRF
ncbi:GNAT family N-acetyltransferase [Neorhizobium galegae]|uniref:GNAT family N-acetyltransferase n=1 Tax=Neorhizobium galegae TaxID=399 RepID=UPI000621586F|nr:GNAT family N-acetyltransferase [Neorhizobium galegae]KAB1124564.1 GNAT family N-acetyltransferase [Neorhizobium galegae]MCQ1810415.1 GNAT family N-acetyltransferase [Neorhizobium galegae]CDZ62886.1 Putative acyltransferase [Neorhizobium galegae bv. orientalis]